jgi:hypothetical protein
MARTAKKKIAKKAVKKAAKKHPKTIARKSAGRKRLAAFTGGHVHPDDQICGCDLDIRDSDSTPDDMLPAARGGVEKAA